MSPCTETTTARAYSTANAINGAPALSLNSWWEARTSTTPSVARGTDLYRLGFFDEGRWWGGLQSLAPLRRARFRRRLLPHIAFQRSPKQCLALNGFRDPPRRRAPGIKTVCGVTEAGTCARSSLERVSPFCRS